MKKLPGFFVTLLIIIYFLFLSTSTKAFATTAPNFCQPPYDSNTGTGGFPIPLSLSVSPSVCGANQPFAVTIHWAALRKSYPIGYSRYNNIKVQVLVLDYLNNVQTAGGNIAVDDPNTRNGQDRTLSISNLPISDNYYSVVLAPGTWAPGSTNYCIVGQLNGAFLVVNNPPPNCTGCPAGLAPQNQRCVVGVDGCSNPNNLNVICKPGLICDHDPAYPDAQTRGLCEPPNVTLNPLSGCPQVGQKCSGTNDTSCQMKGCPTANMTCQGPNPNGDYSCQGPTPVPPSPQCGEHGGNCNADQYIPTFAPFNTCPNGICSTAIGPIHADPQTFITDLFRIAMTVGGSIALILIIFSGYQMVVSTGKPDKIKGAQETLTAAIVGLLFIIFSMVILETIGVDILHIPGLTH